MTKLVGFLTNYVLIDFENVQPKNLNVLKGEHFKIYLFLGAKQTRIDVPLATAMHEFGPERARYIRVSETRANALDFHMTYYLGQLVTRDPDAYFHLITKDKGFDPLIDHLMLENINVRRREALADIPISNISKDADLDEKFDAIIKNLIGRGQAKPRTEKTLKNVMRNVFKEGLTKTEVNALYNKLTASNYITSSDNKISYSLPR
ncbi:PIN domain-containing protein [Litorimonas sp. WD9-15]|uniref:PIN domain-containing protein n=1 Tax=Litorimonas sp. WD9-15 TaxID=3418716 RepID=UPI003D0786C8